MNDIVLAFGWRQDTLIVFQSSFKRLILTESSYVYAVFECQRRFCTYCTKLITNCSSTLLPTSWFVCRLVLCKRLILYRKFEFWEMSRLCSTWQFVSSTDLVGCRVLQCYSRFLHYDRNDNNIKETKIVHYYLFTFNHKKAQYHNWYRAYFLNL